MVNPTTPPVPTAISGLPSIPIPPSGSDFIPVSQNGVTYKAAANTLGGTGPAGPTGPAGTVVPWCVAGGSADAITGAFTPAITSLPDGLLLNFRATTANATTTPTFKADGTTAHTITDLGGGALVATAIPAQFAEMSIRYNLANTRWELMNPANTASGVTTTGSPANGNLAKFSGASTVTNANLSGDITTAGGVATTLATVNSNVGSFNTVTVNAKGLVTAATNSTWTLLSTQTISSSTASVSVTAGITSAYTHYVWEITNLVPITNTVDAYFTLQQGGVFVAGSAYNTQFSYLASGAVSGEQFTSQAKFIITANTPIVTNQASVLIIEFWQPAIASPLNIAFKGIFPASNSSIYSSGGGILITNAATTGIKLVMSSGNIASCTANLYGLL